MASSPFQASNVNSKPREDSEDHTDRHLSERESKGIKAAQKQPRILYASVSHAATFETQGHFARTTHVLNGSCMSSAYARSPTESYSGPTEYLNGSWTSFYRFEPVFSCCFSSEFRGRDRLRRAFAGSTPRHCGSEELQNAKVWEFGALQVNFGLCPGNSMDFSVLQ